MSLHIRYTMPQDEKPMKKRPLYQIDVLAYVPGGLEIIKEFLQPEIEAGKAQARRTLGQKAEKSYEVDGFAVCYLEDQKERVEFVISRKDGDKSFSINLQLEALH